jgi:outer membrane protein assembly factor BamB
MSAKTINTKTKVSLMCAISVLILQLGACLIGCNSCGEKMSWKKFLLPVIRSVKLAENAPWPMWQHDPAHTGRSPYVGPTKVTAATYENYLCCFGLFGSPVIGGKSRVYVGSIRSAGDTLNCAFFVYPSDGASGLLHGIKYDGTALSGFPFDSRSGSVMATAIECAPLLLDDGSILYGKDDGYMYRVGPAGSLFWKSPADDHFDQYAPTDDNEQMIPSPLLGPDNTAVFLSHFADVYGPGPTADAVALACPALDPFPFNDTATRWYSKLYAIDARNGRRLWVFDPETDPASGGKMVGWGSPALGADGSYIICLMHTELSGDHYVPTTGRVFAIGPDGERRWVYPPQGNPPLGFSIWTSPVISSSGSIYIGASDYGWDGPAEIIALNSTGGLLWEYSLSENTIVSSPALESDGTIIAATQNRHSSDTAQQYGRIYALTDIGTGAVEQWRYPAAGTVPWGFYSSPLVDASGNIYIASEPFPFNKGVPPGVLLGLKSDGDLIFSIDLAGFVHGNLALGNDGALMVPLRKPPLMLVFKDP